MASSTKRIALEVLPERRTLRFDPTGHEELEPEVLPDERFVQFVRQLELVKDEDRMLIDGQVKRKRARDEDNIAGDGDGGDGEGAGNGNDSEDESDGGGAHGRQSRSQWPQVREEVAHHLGRANYEIAKLVEVIAMVEAGVDATVIDCQRPPLPLKTQSDALLGRLAIKRQALKSAREHLSTSQTRLEASSAKAKNFLDDVKALRARWKIKAPQQTSGLNYVPIYMVDFSFGSDGSQYRGAEVQLRWSKEGSVETSLHIDHVDKVLRIGVPGLFVDIFTYQKVLSVNEAERVSVHATGVEAVSELLDNAQQSLFITELFDALCKAAIKLKLSDVQLLEKALHVDTLSSEAFSIRLLSQRDLASLPPHKNMADLSLEEFQRRRRYALVGLKCLNLLRAAHKKRLQNFFRLPLSSTFIRDTSQDFDADVLKGALNLYRHLVTHDAVKNRLHGLADTVSNLTFTSLALGNQSDLVSAFDITFLKSCIIDIGINGTKINVRGAGNIDSPAEALQLITQHLRHHLLSTFATTARDKGCEAASIDANAIALVNSSKRLEISVTGGDVTHLLEVKAKRVSTTTNNKEKVENVSLSELVGETIADKVSSLIDAEF